MFLLVFVCIAVSLSAIQQIDSSVLLGPGRIKRSSCPPFCPGPERPIQCNCPFMGAMGCNVTAIKPDCPEGSVFERDYLRCCCCCSTLPGKCVPTDRGGVGHCPNVTGMAGTCIEACRPGSCPAGELCCPNGCGNGCKKPVIP